MTSAREPSVSEAENPDTYPLNKLLIFSSASVYPKILLQSTGRSIQFQQPILFPPLVASKFRTSES